MNILLALLMLVSGAFAHPTLVEKAPIEMVYDFSKITPSTTLNWTPCFDNFTCTRLEVPWDYKDASVGTVAVAFIKSAAIKASSKTQDIVFGPGGPGGSGVDAVLSGIDSLRMVLGDKHNIISFDARGVNNTAPNLSCFNGSSDAETTFWQTFYPGVDSDSPQSIADKWALAGAYGDWCSKAHQNDKTKYADTSAAAQDLLRFVDVLHKDGKGKLWYYGASYGTALGATFATLFPDRVGRMILDGVIDIEDWFSGLWNSEAADVDRLFEKFFQQCYEAGQSKCSFYASSPQKVQQRFDRLLANLKASPLPVSDSAILSVPTYVRYEDILYVAFLFMYAPAFQWDRLSAYLVQLESGNGSKFASDLKERYTWFGDTVSVIACLDVFGGYNVSTVDTFASHVKYQKSRSKYGGEIFPSYSALCRQMTTAPPPSQRFAPKISGATTKTSYPLLFLTNELDPITPFESAQKMHKFFDKSGLVVTKQDGHTSYYNVIGNCTIAQVQSYLGGKASPDSITCQPSPDGVPFGLAGNSTA